MYLIPEHLWVSIDNNAKILINLANGNADLLQEKAVWAVERCPGYEQLLTYAVGKHYFQEKVK